MQVLGRCIESSSQLTPMQLHTIGAAQALHAAKLARGWQSKGLPPTAAPAAGALASSAGGVRPLVASRPTAASSRGGGGGGGGGTNRHAPALDLDSLRPSSASAPPVGRAMSMSLGHRTQSLSRGPGDMMVPKGERMALPPLPVPLAELRPALWHDPSFADVALAAYELLLLGCGTLGAGVRVSEVGYPLSTL